MAAILFICLVNNKNNAFLYYYKMLNPGQNGFKCLKRWSDKILLQNIQKQTL